MQEPSSLGDVLISVTAREGIIDCAHFGSAIVADAEGKIAWHLGNAHRPVFERSITKPFKALAVLRSGALDTFGLDDVDLALIAGSHSGTVYHVARGQQILSKLDLSEEALKCDIRLPIGEDALFELARNEIRLCKVHNDCSGEHIGALAICRHFDLNLEKYLERTHPVQRLFEKTISEFSGGGYNRRMTVTDRCGMPTSPMPLVSLAVRTAKLLGAAKSDPSVARLLKAIISNPMVYTGRNRIAGELIMRSRGKIFGKCGAEGVYTIGWLDNAIALAVKVGDGQHRGALPVMERAAREVGLWFPKLMDCINDNSFSAVCAP